MDCVDSVMQELDGTTAVNDGATSEPPSACLISSFKDLGKLYAGI
jgi:hypothetical protein